MNLVQIGNSRGIRIPKAYIDKYGFGGGVCIIEEEDGIKILPEKAIRKGWSQFYQKNADLMEIDQDFLDAGIADEFEEDF